MPPRKKYYSAYCLRCGVGHNKMINTCLVPGCDGRMGTEGEIVKQQRTKCNHLISDGLNDFNYCPMCGQRLKQKNRT